LFQHIFKLKSAVSVFLFLSTLGISPVFAGDAVPIHVLVKLGKLYEAQNQRLLISLKDPVSKESFSEEITPELAWKYLSFTSFIDLQWPNSTKAPLFFQRDLFRSWFLKGSLAGPTQKSLITLVQNGFQIGEPSLFNNKKGFNSYKPLKGLASLFGDRLLERVPLNQRSEKARTSKIPEYQLGVDLQDRVKVIRGFYSSYLNAALSKDHTQTLIEDNGNALLELIIVQLNEAGLKFPSVLPVQQLDPQLELTPADGKRPMEPEEKTPSFILDQPEHAKNTSQIDPEGPSLKKVSTDNCFADSKSPPEFALSDLYDLPPIPEFHESTSFSDFLTLLPPDPSPLDFDLNLFEGTSEQRAYPAYIDFFAGI
jgi:hypothetical protein